MSSGQIAAKRDERAITYVPFGETKEITLTLSVVRSNIAVPTKAGCVPSDADLVRFMMLCQARELNPWVGDAYLVGYDTQAGPKFSLITAIQALLKRAEVNPNFDGMESGVVVTAGETVYERQGNLVFPHETLFGGWARLWRKDRAHPFYDALKLSTYSTGKSQWEKDPAGMIDKCAQASVLRMAFPSQLGALYIEQERGAIERGMTEHVTASGPKVTTLDGLAKRLLPPASPDAPAPAEKPEDCSQEEPPVVNPFAVCKTVQEVEKLMKGYLDKKLSDDEFTTLKQLATERKAAIQAAKSGKMFETQPDAVEAGQ